MLVRPARHEDRRQDPRYARRGDPHPAKGAARPVRSIDRRDWVEDKVTKAFAEERQRGGVVLFPVRVDDAVFATKEAWAAKLRDNRHIGDFRAWKDHDAYQTASSRCCVTSRSKLRLTPQQQSKTDSRETTLLPNSQPARCKRHAARAFRRC